ncbi:MAG: peptidylprolyl isomerase [Candidatus Omnitrophota bacterium]
MSKQVISFNYVLTDKNGQMIDASPAGSPLVFLEGAGQIIQALEDILVTLKAGEKSQTTILAKDAYGIYDQNQIYRLPKNKFPEDAKAGDVFRVGTEQDNRVVNVIEVTETEVVCDANHPLAGQDLSFAVEVVDRRDATAEELAHGHAHGAGGHHHHH